jgi:HTH DNA binding domain
MTSKFPDSYRFRGQMPGDPEDDDEFWRPPWDTDDEIEPPGPLRTRKPAAEPDYDHPLLTPLARAQDAIARLEAKVGTASDAVAEGLRARLAYLEAAGWLRHAHVWIHPWDLALRDNALTGSYAAAAFGDRLATELPSTAAQESDLALLPSDTVVNEALQLARLWRRLAELHAWRPLADSGTLRETLQSLGCRVPEDPEIADWLASVHMLERGPALIRAGRAARDWMNLPGVDPRSPDGVFLAACLWREKSARGPIPLPFWSAPEAHHHRLELHFGVQWMADFLECVTAAAIVGLRELERLRQAELKGQVLGPTARSRLPDALNAVLRVPIVTASSLANSLDVTPQAALGLLRQLMAARIVREATGRASWRAFALV